MELEVSDYFDKIIAEADSNVKEDLETKKTAALDALKPKVGNLDFWSKVKVASNEPKGIPSFGNDASSGAQTPSYMAWGERQAEETTTIPFPISPKVYHFHPIAFVEQMRMMRNISKEEARVRAYMRMLRVGEGTGEIIKSYDRKKKKIIYISNDFDKGYSTAFGGNKITDFSDHPRKNYGGSSAAGAYQIMGYTWDDKKLSLKREKYNIHSFDELSQDKFCLILMKYHAGCSEFINLIIKGEIEKATRQCGNRIWASLPYKGDNSRYKFKGEPQPATPMKEVLEHFETFYKEELEGKTNLHLKTGFLHEFGYNY